jgi:ribonuclease Z
MTKNLCHIQIIGTDTGDSSPSVLVFFDTQRYLFNAGEGAQRFAIEHKVRLAKLNHVFMTEISSTTVSGLPGLCLTAADIGVPALTLHGPRNTKVFMRAAHRFLHRRTMKLDVREFTPKHTHFQDEYLHVEAVCLRQQHRLQSEYDQYYNAISSAMDLIKAKHRKDKRQRLADTSSCTTPTQPSLLLKSDDTADDTSVIDNADATSQQCKKRRIDDGDDTTRTDTNCTKSVFGDEKVPLDSSTQRKFFSPPSSSKAERFKVCNTAVNGPRPIETVCYICQTHDQPGKFRVDLAKKLGIKPGPVFGKLKNGQTVVFTDANGNEQTVRPDQVVDPSIPGEIFAIVHCPDESLVHSLMNSAAFAKYNSDSSDSKQSIRCIIHITPQHLIDSSVYASWMKSFGSDTQHIIINHTACPQYTVFESSRITLNMLQHLEPNVFLGKPSSSGMDSTQYPVLSDHKELNIVAAQPLMRYTVLPSVRQGINTTDMLAADCTNRFDAKFASLREANPDFDTQLQNARNTLQQVRASKAEHLTDEHTQRVRAIAQANDNLRVTFLGTGSAIPSKYRNVSGILVELTDIHVSMLFDAGEGSYGQLVRALGRNGADDVVRRLKFVWISHMHADHHLGLTRILARRQQLRQGSDTDDPIYVMGPQQLFSWLSEFASCSVGDVNFVFTPCSDATTPTHEFASTLETLGISKLWNVPVIHCFDSYAVVMEHKCGWKFVYSGDTRPCDDLIEAGRDATILVHEATLDTSLQEDAIAKRHSTTGEALEVGRKMNAARIVLSHFSQRYPKLPSVAECGSITAVAFDLLSFSLTDLIWLPCLTSSLELLFPPDDDEPVNLNRL